MSNMRTDRLYNLVNPGRNYGKSGGVRYPPKLINPNYSNNTPLLAFS